MKLNILLFSFIALLLFLQCNTITRSKNLQKLLKQTHVNQQQDSILAAIKADIASDNNISSTENHKNPLGILIDRTDNSPVPLDKKIQVAKTLGAGGSIALQNGNGSLRQTGEAVKKFIDQHYR